MTVVLSMKTFQKLEEKLGAESAKQVYELAEAIYEEVEKKLESKLDQFELSIEGTENENISKVDLMSLRKDFNTQLAKFKEEQLRNLKESFSKFRRSFSRVTLLLIINLILVLLIVGFLAQPLLTSVFNGG